MPEIKPDDQVQTIKPDNSNQEDPKLSNLQKQLEDAQKKIEEQGRELKDASVYVQQANTIATLIARNKKIQDMVRAEYEAFSGTKPSGDQDKQEPQKPNKNESNDMEEDKYKQLDEKVSKTERSQRTAIARDFEERHGISKLPSEKQQEVRQKIMEHLSVYGVTVNDVPIERLDSVMENAFNAVNNEVVVEHGIAHSYTNQSGAFGSMSGRVSDMDEEEGLTAAQKDWARKFGLDVNEVEKVKKNQDQPFIPKAEKVQK